MLSRRCVLGVLFGGSLTFWASAQPSTENEKVLIRASKPYTSLVQQILARGGRVSREFKYVDAIAAEIPRSALPALSAMTADGAITKDLVVLNPAPVDTSRGRNLAGTGDETRIQFDSVQPLSAVDVASIAGAAPNAYLLNNSLIGARALHNAGFTGAGVTVAVIDSGIRPNFPHISLDGSVVGCEDFVGDALGCSNAGNDGHGTFVAGMVSANVVFAFSTTSSLRNAVLAECPQCFLDPPANTLIPMIGTAPQSSIYALRVFGATGGAPTSRILAAVERVLELREKFDQGQPGGANIRVCNISLGGSTVFAGRDLFDTAVDELLRRDIVPVIAGGNAGPATLTVGSPGTSFNALTVGAASLPHNERILRRLQSPSDGPLYRPYLGVQTAYFSSRGPDADGRTDPDVTANGFACYGQGYFLTSNISFASGTSFSTPSVAGVAALLRQAFPQASAARIRNAIIMGANRNLLTDGSTVLDQGAGYVNAAGARDLLAAGSAPDTLPSPSRAERSVQENVRNGADLQVENGYVRRRLTNLQPGQRQDLLYAVPPNAGQVVVTLSNVTPALPPSQQNQLFGDDILLAIHTAKTSSIGDAGDYRVFTFTTGGTFLVNNPESGLMRISVNGDWTNAGSISADVTVSFSEQPNPEATTNGRIANGQVIAIPIVVPAGTNNARFRVEWSEDWGRYPTNDIDMILLPPGGAPPNFAGATLGNPEAVSINNPAAGTWIVRIEGFEVHSRNETFKFRAELDGRLVH